MNPGDRLCLHRARAALLVIDVQARLCTAMNPDRLRRVRQNTVILVEGAKALGLPVFVTEQYPKGIGPTVEDVAAALPPGQRIFEKLTFSCAGVPELMEALDALAASGRDQLLVAGMETHVCVFQTVRDLLLTDPPRAVFAVEDAMISRTEENHAVGLELMARAGAVRTSAEAALFDLLGQAGTAEFKKVSKLIK
ncbi:MAG: isochorismatase family protein [Polyangia bacterium]|jgi:nicotinamidase-related amidase|nr:isochorismatase family protein [Polyangia bacterium]